MGTGFFFGKGEPYLAKSGPYTIPAQVFDRKKKRNLHIKYGTWFANFSAPTFLEPVINYSYDVDV